MQLLTHSEILRKLRSCLFISAACLALQAASAGTGAPAASGTEVSPVPSSQQDASSAAGRATGQPEQVMEEITVIGQQQIFDLRQKIILAEDRAFDIFNRLNDDDMYDVHCEMVARTGTLIRRRMCMPNFYHMATANEAQEFLSQNPEFSIYPQVAVPAKLVFIQQYPIFKEKVKQLAQKNPELMRAMQKLFSLTEELRVSRNIYHGEKDN